MNRSTCGLLVLALLIALPMTSRAQTTTITNLLVLNSARMTTNSTASGTNSAAFGLRSRATGAYSFAEGSNTLASGLASHAEGFGSTSTAQAAHSEGYATVASGSVSHAEGSYTIAGGMHSHAQGYLSRAHGVQSDAGGLDTIASGSNSFSGGKYTEVVTNHHNAFIFASGTAATNRRSTAYSDTAHFERMHLFSSANDNPSSVLARAENDGRYATTAQGTKADTAIQPGSSISVSNITASGGLSVRGVASFSNSVSIHNSGLVLSNSAFIVVGYGVFGSLFLDNSSSAFYDNNNATNSAYYYTPALMTAAYNDSTNLHQAKAALVIHNDAGETNTWTKLAFVGREGVFSGNAVALAGLAAQKRASTPGNWAVGDLVMWTKNYAIEDERMRIQGSNGYVGIGTNSPSARLEVAGDGKFASGVRFPAQGDVPMGVYTNGTL